MVSLVTLHVSTLILKSTGSDDFQQDISKQ